MYNQFYQQYQQPMGFTYPPQIPKAKNVQPLTPEQITKLRRGMNALDLQLKEEDLWKAICTHKEKESGKSTLVSNPDGSYTCTICGESFEFADLEEPKVTDAVNRVVNILQTIKTIYLDGSEELFKQFMQILPLIKKIPLLTSRALANFSMYDSNNAPVNQTSPNYSGFMALGNMMTNPYGYQQQPMMGYGYQQQPMYQQQPQQMSGYPYQPDMGYGYYQPMYQPQMGYQQPGANPMAYGAPQQPAAPAPTAPAPGVVPQAAPAAAQPQAAPQKEVQQQQVFNV